MARVAEAAVAAPAPESIGMDAARGRALWWALWLALWLGLKLVLKLVLKPGEAPWVRWDVAGELGGMASLGAPSEPSGGDAMPLAMP